LKLVFITDMLDGNRGR